MARKLSKVERETLSMARASSIHVPAEWFDGDVWELDSLDYAPHSAEVARQLIRSHAVKAGHKLASKIKNGKLFIQAIPASVEVVENDNDEPGNGGDVKK